jgi:hypothetical protein
MRREGRTTDSQYRNDLPVTDRKSFLLRIDPEVLGAVQRWANDDLRSLNGQIEFLLRKLLKQEGRLAEDRRSSGGSSRKPSS